MSKTVLRRPTISLGRMLLWPEDYLLSDVCSTREKVVHTEDQKFHLAVAQTIVKSLLSHPSNAIPVEEASFRLKLGCAPHFFDDLAWWDPGSAVLNIPEGLRERMLEILHKGPAGMRAETEGLAGQKRGQAGNGSKPKRNRR